MTFQIGQTFTKEAGYPPEAAVWSNENNAYIEELSDGSFVIKAVPAPTTEELEDLVRRKRDALLHETDYLIMPDYPLSEEEKAQVIAYRTTLRDLPEQAGFPEKVVFPEMPSAYKHSN